MPLVNLFAQIPDVDVFSQVLQIGGLGSAMVVAYKVTSKAARDATDVAKSTAADLAQRLTDEREHHAAQQAVLLARIATLEDEISQAK